MPWSRLLRRGSGKAIEILKNDPAQSPLHPKMIQVLQDGVADKAARARLTSLWYEIPSLMVGVLKTA